MSQAEEVQPFPEDEVDGKPMKEDEVRSYLRRNRCFLENFVVEEVGSDTIERWVIKRTQKESYDSQNKEVQSNKTYAVPTLGSCPREQWPPKIAGTHWDIRGTSPKAEASPKLEFGKASNVMDQRMAERDPKSKDKDFKRRTSTSKFITLNPEAPLSVKKKDPSRKV